MESASTNLSVFEITLTAIGLVLINGGALIAAWNKMVISDAKQEVRISAIEREHKELRDKLNENTTNDRRDYERLMDKLDSLRSHMDSLFKGKRE